MQYDNAAYTFVIMLIKMLVQFSFPFLYWMDWVWPNDVIRFAL